MTSPPANSRARCPAVLKSLVVLAGLLVFTGCSHNPIYVTTGIVMSSYANDEATPYVNEMWDMEMACSMGEGLDPLVYSFSRVTDAPDVTGSLLMELAGNCSEKRAWEAELEYLRADYLGNVPAAKDARERTKRLNAEVASRRYLAFRRAMQGYNFDPSNASAQCPDLPTEQDEFAFLVGLITGLQAVVNDANSGGHVGVPRDLAPQAERAISCINNKKWGGVPNAVRAFVWLLLPDTRPENAKDSWLVFEESSRLGIAAGIRTSMALQVVAADTFARKDVLEQTIARFAEAEDTIDIWPEYRIMDAVAGDVIQFFSDKYWTRQTGHRTPQRRFGSLDDEIDRNVEVMDLDGLL